ncbi:aldehyde dehydrogenase family protein [Shouchella clausii]|uniref:aldehyde dehydrogenase family protein n=1 Tax=Shouchella clausii TaxID=79880 RepID=UPI000BA592E4|nr:aldehyde dehydrogenase family protein [Shouchella clausii]PAD17572.1 aldehyde dehydrogenase [Shouchella clausii]
MKEAYSYIDGRWLEGKDKTIAVRSPYSGEVVGKQSEATEEEVELALEAAFTGKKKIAALPAKARASILNKAASLLKERKETFAQLISLEVGKALKNTRDEVARSIETLEQSAEEAKRLHGTTLPGDVSERGKASMALTFRVPVGVVAAITPFNAPLNLICHKIGPSFAAGNATILKPAPQSSLIAAAFVELLLQAEMPAEAVQLVIGGTAHGQRIVEDWRTNIVSFTGGVAGGKQICHTAGLKKVLLELGGNSATIVHQDADVERAATLCVRTGFSNAGQSCISVQRIYVHESVMDFFLQTLKQQTARLVVGDPLAEDTDVGCVINEETGERIERWVKEAVAEGAELVCGGRQDRALIQPTILLGPRKKSKVVCEEVFGPVISVIPYTSLETAIAEVNDSAFGLQAGIFSNSLPVITKVALELEMGGVVVNGTSNYRLDHWPYGGIKQSGIGREGPKYTVKEMTEMKMVVLQDLL